jgi:hypothetical protein
VCGGVCCPNGQSCVDPNTQKCAPCPTGKVPCKPDAGASICCAPVAGEVSCCPGKCCLPSQYCHARTVGGKLQYFCESPG